MLQLAQEELDRFTQLGGSYSKETQMHVGVTRVDGGMRYCVGGRGQLGACMWVCQCCSENGINFCPNKLDKGHQTTFRPLQVG